MEMFKVCEKETKTKTYSKEGLARTETLNPEEQAREDARIFLQEAVEKLQIQIEASEAEVEKLSVKKSKNKTDIDKRIALIARHRWHIAKMEQMIRMVDNDGV